MIAILLALVMVAAPFWEAKQPEKWTDEELTEVLTASPWVKVATAGNMPGVGVYLATAKPMRLAEAELERLARAKALRENVNSKEPEFDPAAQEYAEWLAENGTDQIILAVNVGYRKEYGDERELERLEKESVMVLGRKKVQMTGYFPPSAGDPVLRVAFPRQVSRSDRDVRFELYLPGVAGGFRAVEFRVEELVFGGRPEL